MDLGLSFTFAFEDEEWVKKLLMAAIAALIPFIGWIPLLGWAILIARRVIRRDSEPLPDWSDLGELFTLGLKGLVIVIIAVLIPLLLAIPFAVLGALGSDSDAIYTIYSLCYGCFNFLYGLALAFVLPASFGILADTDQLADALNPSKVIALVRAAPSAYLMALVGGIGASIVADLGIILCFIGVFFTMAYAAAITGHLYGQAYNQASELLV
jgi:hypothetical protein